MLFDVLWVAGAVYSVKASFVPVSGGRRAEAATELHRGGRLDGEFAANWTFGTCVDPEVPERRFLPRIEEKLPQ